MHVATHQNSQIPGLSSTVRAVLICSIAVAAIACTGSERGSSDWTVVQDLTAPPDAELLDQAILGGGPLLAWDLSNPDRAQEWRVGPPGIRSTVGTSGLTIQLRDGDPGVILTVPVELDASSASEVVVEIDGREIGPSRLLWGTDEAGFGGSRRLAPSRTVKRDDGWALHFEVTEHPEWRGTIRRLRIKPLIGSKGTFDMRSVRVMANRATSEEADRLQSRAWKMSLDETVRPTAIGLPDRPWTVRLRVPEGDSELRFVPGLSKGLRKPIELVVSANPAEGESTELLVAPVVPGPDHRDRWLEEQRVSLSEFEGRDVEISLGVRGLETAGGQGRFVAWGSTQLVSRSPRETKPNVVLIILDTLRADHLSTYGYPRQTSPNIDRWAQDRATVFRSAVAPSPWTLPSHISMFSGIDPIRHGANYHHPARSDFDMLAEILQREGYETAAWTGGGFLGSDYGLHQGFDRYTYRLGHKETELSDHVTAAIEWLDGDRDRPFFLMLHSYEVHEPYFEREPYYSAFQDESGAPEIDAYWVASRRMGRSADDGFLQTKRLASSVNRGKSWQPVGSEYDQSLVDRYDSGIAFADEQIGLLLERLRAEDPDETVIVLTSDHGEGLGEHGLYGHSYLYDFNLLVPLIVQAPGPDWSGGTTVSQQVRVVDVMPTILELTGLEAPENLDGKSLSAFVGSRSSTPPRPAWSYAAASNRGVSLRLPDSKYIFANTPWRNAFGADRVFDLDDDPDESTNIAQQRSEVADRMLDRITKRLARDSAGLWIRAQSGSDRPLSLRLSDPNVVNPTRLKALLLPEGGLDFDSNRDGTLLDLPPGSEALVYAEVSAEASITIELTRGPAAETAETWTVAVEEVAAEPLSLILEDGTWTEKPGLVAGDGPLVSAYLTGSVASSASARAMSPELEEQLRALGYVD